MIMYSLEMQWDRGMNKFLCKLQHHTVIPIEFALQANEREFRIIKSEFSHLRNEAGQLISMITRSVPQSLSYMGRCSNCFTWSHWNVFCRCLNKLWPYLSMQCSSSNTSAMRLSSQLFKLQIPYCLGCLGKREVYTLLNRAVATPVTNSLAGLISERTFSFLLFKHVYYLSWLLGTLQPGLAAFQLPQRVSWET